MAKSQNQKTKVLYLERMMRETGENRVLSMPEILNELFKYGISAERKSVYDDFDALRAFGMDIKFKRGRNGGYYLAGNVVEDTEESLVNADSISGSFRGEGTVNVDSISGSFRGEGIANIDSMDGDSAGESLMDDKFVAKSGVTWDFPKVSQQDGSDENESGKKIKLQFTKEKEAAVREYFGSLEECKEKNEYLMTGCVTYVCDSMFFGWLTAMGKDVKILKPKKLGQSYREYLKAIAKAYK